MQIKQASFVAGLAALVFFKSALAADVTVPMYLTDANGDGQKIGTVRFESRPCGILMTPNLTNLAPGEHGFHIHAKPSCKDSGMAAGGHFDPKTTDQHNGPYEHAGHQGDLPVLIVNKDGTATLPTFAPNLTMKDLKGHALMIHANGDNYSDKPEKLGGGGARIACGVIE
jgi:superoxide dismutase, Cu-Zn family